jgi:hypothetical protein
MGSSEFDVRFGEILARVVGAGMLIIGLILAVQSLYRWAMT